MKLDTTIAQWVGKVPNRQWPREDMALTEMGSDIPEIIAESKPLSEVHRLDLSLFVIFEEAALRVSGALTRSAPDLDTLNFSAQQTIDEARHNEIFLNRLGDSCKALGMEKTVINEAIKTPPLRRFLECCDEVIDRGDFVEGLTLMNLVFEGMAYPLYAYEQRYWKPVDPYLSALIRSAFVDETRHVAYGAEITRNILKGDTDRKAKVTKLCREATLAMNEVFDYYVLKFVKMFDAVSKIHKDLFADAEFAPGCKICETPYKEQVEAIHVSMNQQHGDLLARAGLA